MNKTCRYCASSLEGASVTTQMCDRCKKIHRAEYDRLYKKGAGDMVFDYFTFHKCTFCRNKMMFGSKVCNDCQMMRLRIGQVLAEEFGRSVKNEQEKH